MSHDRDLFSGSNFKFGNPVDQTWEKLSSKYITIYGYYHIWLLPYMLYYHYNNDISHSGSMY